MNDSYNLQLFKAKPQSKKDPNDFKSVFNTAYSFVYRIEMHVHMEA